MLTVTEFVNNSALGIYDPPSIVGLDDGCTSLNLFHRAFEGLQLDLIPYAKRFSPEQQQASQEILQYILKSESNGHAADAQDLYQIASLKGRATTEKATRKPSRIVAAEKIRANTTPRFGRCLRVVRSMTRLTRTLSM